jgi:hypothetical protein
LRKLVPRDTAQRSLGQKGFRVDPSKDHIFFFHVVDGKETGIKTKISHTKSFKEITGDILGMITKQLKLDTSQQTFEFLDCKMSATQYNEIALKNLRR